ncbi:MAG: type II toxin-antitoxin system HicB family antitoxin [Nostoc sp.]|uniref:type II toxin-antitoxin system HicB family antitoxin n=1 Tax=Nostoc sp. TaxID=1180 RepID=UPI002FF5ECEC
MKYTIVIQWSETDHCYVVSLPEFTDIMQPCTHGETYEDTLKNAQEVLEMLIESSLADGEPLPEPKTLGMSLKVAL